MSFRTERVNELIKEELSRLIKNELRDPRISECVISVTKVKTTPDMKYSKIYVSVYGDKSKQTQVFDAIAGAKGFLRKNLASILTTRYAPELVFELDDSLDYAMRIEEVLKEIKANDKE